MAEDKLFEAAAMHLQEILDDLPETSKENDLLYLYARYKQATVGPCNVVKPNFFNFEARKKWNHWNDLKTLSCEEAKMQYVMKIRSLDPAWDPTSTKTRLGTGVSVSIMKNEEEEELTDENKSVFDWCKEGALKNIIALLSDVHSVDDEKRTLLHWACDRGHLNVVKFLIEQGIDVNCQDIEQSTPLHYASSCDHYDIVKLLLLNHADPMIEDSDGEIPVQCCTSKAVQTLLNECFSRDCELSLQSDCKVTAP